MASAIQPGAIRFDRVSKRFAAHRQRPRSFHELFIQGWRLWRRSSGEVFWALREVSFEVGPGETVGVIGSNGAGKSTVLKLAARVLEPTAGRVEVRGRVAALLELGVGFHPELTGRENVFLNGAFLGLSRREMARRLEAIVAFAELEDFIDVPVKHYSSGMYVRLAFAVAAHLDPEILLVDEVLAVGDAAFQRKCLEHLIALQRSGVTILLVSHDLGAVRWLCHRALWLDHGRLRMEGSPEAVAQAYLAAVEAHEAARPIPIPAPRSPLRIERVYLTDGHGREREEFETGEAVSIRVVYRASTRVERPVFGLALQRSDGLRLGEPNTRQGGLALPAVEGVGEVVYAIPAVPLLEGLYWISAVVTDGTATTVYDRQDRACALRITSGRHPERGGLVAMNGTWHHVPLEVRVLPLS